MAGYEKPRQRVNNSMELYSRMMARRAMYGEGGGGGGLGSGIESLGSDLGRGIGEAIARGKQNSAAENQMQQYNDINPPRGDLVSVPGESVPAWMQQNPNVPVTQSTIPAPYGQGAQGMQTWLQMQGQQRAQDTAQQMAAYRGVQMAGAQQRMQLGQATLAQKYQALGAGPKLPAGANADLNKLATANALAKQYTGLTLDDVTKNPSDWHKSEDGTFYTNDVLSKYYNRQIAVSPADWEAHSAAIMSAGAILQRYQNTPMGPEINRQLGLSRAGQPNMSEPQGSAPGTPGGPQSGAQAQAEEQGDASYVGSDGQTYYRQGGGRYSTSPSAGQPPQVQRAQPTAGGQIPQTQTNQQVLPPSSNMQSDYFKNQGTGAVPTVPNASATGTPAPVVAGQQGKQQSTVDQLILKALGSKPSDIPGNE